MIGKIISCAVFLVIVGAVAFVAVYFTGQNEDVNKVGDEFQKNLLDLFLKKDPYSGLNNTNAWPNNGQGLQLTILNALSDEWYEYFNTAVQQWDDGTPDALSLTIKIVAPETNCTPEDNYLKVCNGNYGETDWKGINQALIDDQGYIFASTSLMNEHYLPSTIDPTERQYTMCHEMGHGFGLPHTDENFYNLDQGNCLDYTMNPRTNQQPSSDNYLLLAKIYGEMNNKTSVGRDTSNTTTSSGLFGKLNFTSFKNDEDATEKNVGDGGRYMRSRLVANNEELEDERINETVSRTSRGGIPSWVREASHDIHKFYLSTRNNNIHPHDSKYPRQIVHQSKFGEVHEFDIGSGHSIRVRLLFHPTS